MSLAAKVLGLFINPRKTFELILKDGQPAIEFSWMILCFAVSGCLVAYIGSKRFDPYYFGASSIAFLLAWFGYSSILYIFSKAFGGEGKFMHILEGMALTMTSLVVLLVVETPFVSVHPGHLDVGIAFTTPPVIIFGIWLMILIVFLVSELMHMSKKRAFAAYLFSTIIFYIVAGIYFGIVAYFH